MAFPYVAGGLSVSANFISEYIDTTPNYIRDMSPQNTIITGEDGNRYYVAGGVEGAGGSGSTFIVHNADTGVQAFSKSSTQVRTDANAAGVTPPNQRGSAVVGGACAIPETPYIVVIAGGASGVTTDKIVLYYKINSSSQLEVVGGYAGSTGGLDVQGSPPGAYGNAFSAAGHIISTPVNGSINTIPYQYPIAMAYYGEGRSSIAVVPSINYIIANTPITESLTSNWLVKEANLGTLLSDNNVLRVEDNTALLSRGFFLPRSGGGSRFAFMFYNTTLDAVNATTETISSTYLDTYAPLYPDGLISSVDVALSVDATAFGFSPSLSTLDPDFHTIIKNLDFSSAFPFEDDEDNYDGSAGTAANNYYCNPSVYPSDITDPTAPWFVFVPRVYRKAGERDKLGIRVLGYDTEDEVLYNLAFEKGQVVTTGSGGDVSSINPSSVSVWWDRTTGRLDVFIRSTETGVKALVVTTFGSFVAATEAAPAQSEDLLTRGWAFELDSHSFYVLRLGQQGTFVYDLLTQQWSEWQTQGYDIWNAVHGVSNWNDKIVAGDLNDGVLWEVDPDATLDEGTKPITRTVTGILPNRERAPKRLMELRVMGSVGDPYIDGAALSLSWSDDQGQTYSTPITIDLEDANNQQTLRFRSLGRFDSPLRIFDITDVGGLVRIDGVDVEVK